MQLSEVSLARSKYRLSFAASRESICGGHTHLSHEATDGGCRISHIYHRPRYRELSVSTMDDNLLLFSMRKDERLTYYIVREVPDTVLSTRDRGRAMVSILARTGSA